MLNHQKSEIRNQDGYDLLELLPDVKGAALSILVYLSMSGNRSVSIGDLKDVIGFTEKPIRTGLKRLRELGLITEGRRNRYQLTGREYQLPLYWDEVIEPNQKSEIRNQKYLAGDIPENRGVSPLNAGVSPEVERRLSRLEKFVFGEEKSEIRNDAYQLPEKGVSPLIAGDFPLWDSEMDEDPEVEVLPREEWAGNIPGKMGVFPIDQRNKDQGAGSKVSVIKGNWSEAGDSPEIVGDNSEKTGDIPEVLINNITNNPEKEVSKYVGRSTYLPDNKSLTGTELTGTGEIPGKRGAMSVPADADAAWQTAKGQLKGVMAAGDYALMVKDAELIGYAGGHFTVGVKNAQIRDWCSVRLTKSVERILKSFEPEASVSFVISEVCGAEVCADVRHCAGQARYHRRVYEEPSPELLPGDDELTEICNEYLLDPTGNSYSREELQELREMNPDPRVLRFALPKMSCFEAVKKWCGWDYQTAKRMLVTKKYKLTGPAYDYLTGTEKVDLELIYEECERVIRQLGKDNIGAAYRNIQKLIEQGYVPAEKEM